MKRPPFKYGVDDTEKQKAQEFCNFSHLGSRAANLGFQSQEIALPSVCDQTRHLALPLFPLQNCQEDGIYTKIGQDGKLR